MIRTVLKNVTLKIGSGATPRGGQNVYQQEGVALIRSQNVLDFSFSKSGLAYINKEQASLLNNVEVLKDDVLLNITGDSIARVCTVPSDILPARVNQHVSIIRVSNDLDNRYLLYYLQYLKPYLLKICKVGGTRNALTKEALEKLEIVIQDNHKKVASILYTLDKKIDLNNKINEELEQLLKTVYDYWFIQFNFPDSNGKPYRINGGKMVWNESLKREIPDGWEVVTLKNLISESKNGDWGSESINDDSTKCYCVRGADINGLNGIENFDPPVRYIDKSHINRLLKADDLIIEISGGSPTQSTGRMAHISRDVLARLGNKVVCSNFCKAISLKHVNLSYIVSRYWSRLYDSRVFFNHEGKTSGIKNLLFDQLAKDVNIAIPSNDNLINAYYKFEESIDKQKQNNLIQNEELIKLRDWLLPMLMNGQVKVLNN